MGLVAPLGILLGLGILVPLYLHFVRAKDAEKRTLPTVALLQKAMAQAQRTKRLRDVLLLALRITAVLLLAFGAAGPFLWTNALTAEARGRYVLVLDDSMSMGAEDSSGNRFERMREEALEAVANLSPGSEMAVVLGGAPPRLFVPPTEERAILERRLQELEVSGRGTALGSAIETAERIALRGTGVRRVVVYSDFAVHSGPPDAWTGAGQVELRWVRVGDQDAPPNWSLRECRAELDPLDPSGELAILSASLSGPAGEVQVSLRRNEEVMETREIRQGDSATPIRFRIAKDAAVSGLELALEGNEDALGADDSCQVALSQNARTRVLIVRGEVHSGRVNDEVAFLSRALEVSPTHPEVRVLDLASFEASPLPEMDVLVLANTPRLSDQRRVDVSQALEEGRVGIWVTGGENSGPSLRNLPAFGPRRDLPAGTEVSGGPLDGARITKVRSVDPQGFDSLIHVGDVPLFGRLERGRGRASIFAGGFDFEWSALPLHPGFVAFVDAELRFLAGARSGISDRMTTGDVLRLPEGTRVVSPDGETLVRAPANMEEPADGLVAFGETGRAGLYRIEGERLDLRISVQAPASESLLQPLELPEASAGATVRAQAQGEQQRRPLADVFFLLAAIALVLAGLVRSGLGAAVYRRWGRG